MTRTLRVAVTQMDTSPAPTGDRLERADRLVSEVEPFDINLVVLPELFNTGYAYTVDNYKRAEPLNGPTIRWMKNTARQMHVHLAGSILLEESGEIYNSMFIVAPDGRLWRYDKSYPWGWEHAYFTAGRAQGPRRAVIAETDIGDLGMLVCWDAAHLDLWRAYAGRVDMMVVCASPPQASRTIFTFTDGRSLTLDEAGPLFNRLKGVEACIFEEMLARQSAWMGVPTACSSASGRFESPVPNGHASLLSILPAAPWLARYLPHADGMRMAANMAGTCRAFSADGRVAAHLPWAQGESFTVAELTLPHKKQPPLASQPGQKAPWMAYLVADVLLPRVVRSAYRKALLRLNAEHPYP